MAPLKICFVFEPDIMVSFSVFMLQKQCWLA